MVLYDSFQERRYIEACVLANLRLLYKFNAK